MKKFILILICTTMYVYVSYAQDNNANKAKQLLNWVIEGKGDSAIIHLNNTVRAQVSAEMLSKLFAQMQQQIGPWQSTSKWQSKEMQGSMIYYCDLKFQNMSLRFITAFDSDGLANTIRFAPSPANADSSAQAQPTTNNIFKAITVNIECDGFKLPGELDMPANGKGKYPLVILIQGSGPSNRDENAYGNKPFLDLAEGLTSKGIAVLRYDKRTYVYSKAFVPQGKKANYDTETVDDALAAINLAHTFPEVNTDHIYILGHSLGGMLAPRIAQKSNNKLAGIVIMAGNARPFEDLVKEQVHYIASLNPQTTNDSKKQITELDAEIDNIKQLGTNKFSSKITLPLGLPISYWESSKEYNQVKTAMRLQIPMLFLQGERDYQVTMSDFNIWKKALNKHSNVRFISYPDLNHLMQTGVGKSVPSEYLKTGGHISQKVINDIAEFILSK